MNKHNPDSSSDNAADTVYMRAALREAAKAEGKDEVPVGAVAVLDGRIIGRGHNLTRLKKDPTAHAEVVALRAAARRVGNERLVGVDLYCTLEPCPMCAGAIVHARVRRLVFGALDPKAGACGSVLDVIPNRNLNHRPDVVKMVLGEECGRVLTAFFKTRRARRKSAL